MTRQLSAVIGDDTDDSMMNTDSDVDSDASGETDIPIYHGDRKKKKRKKKKEKKEGKEEEEKEDEQQDIDDLVELLMKNNHSPEHYLSMRQTIDLSRTECVNYAIGTLALQDHPKGGPNNILIEFTTAFTKQFLEEKKETEFMTLKIIFDSSLILSPQVILLDLLFADSAFARLDGERILTSASQLLDLDIPEDTYQLEFNL
ncbi:hypothetical protein AJ78_04473 [Emergomyces pasteurianus Ep9510]|uniref:Uncharacterized protein n=1 Tax=Emergomyces pasteurianus Ep9510 TaxID=1447872 RepID=A0A1J9Q4W5_9EURO|nr:hypothetical protein AJ78_04473 [Emergomyces pasteurianus Ep9510]